MSLDTLANVKSRLGITTSADDSLLAQLQDSADAFIQNYCDRDFAGGTFTEFHPGSSEFVHLRNYPILAITSVKVDSAYLFAAESLLDPSRYVVHQDRGVLQSLYGPFLPETIRGLVNADVSSRMRGPKVVQVVYSTNTSQVPNDVKQAYARLIGHWYRRVKTEIASEFQNVSQHKFGETFLIYQGNGTTLPLPEDALALLNAYRSPHI